MNSSELQLVETTIQGLMNPNNDMRKVSEIQLEHLMSNKPLLIITLSQLLNSTTDQAVLIYSSVILRKLLEIKRSEKINSIWEAISPEVKQQIKDNVLLSLTASKNTSLLKKVADIIIQLTEIISLSNETWDQMLKYIINGFLIDFTQQDNQSITEISIYLLGKVFSFYYSQLIQGIDIFIKGFSALFKQGTIEIKALAVQAICEILNDPDNKKSSDKFSPFTFNILETTLLCLNNHDAVNLKTCLLSLGALSHSLPKMLKKSFNDIFILMGKIVESKGINDDSLYSLSYEVLISIISKYPSVISKDREKIVLLINSIFKFGMKFDSAIDDDWSNPKTTSLIHESIIYEENLDHALSLAERMVLGLSKKIILPHISTVIYDLLQHSNEDWRYKYIAYMTIGKLTAFFDDIKSLEKLLEMILVDINNDNPKIRYACINCLFNFSSTFKEDFTNLYHEVALPKMASLLKSDKVLRVKLQLCESIKGFVDKCEKDITDIYLESILDALFFQFMKDDLICPASLREIILEMLESLIEKTPETFPLYAEKCFAILVEYLKVAIKSTDSSLLNLVSFLLDILTNVGQHCIELLGKYSKDIINALIHFQNHIISFKGHIAQKFVNAWERLIPYIRESHQEIIPSLMSSIFKVIEQPPEMSIASYPEVKVDIRQFLSEANSQKPKETLLKLENPSIITSETEEYTIFLQLFILFLESFKEYGLKYIEPTEAEIKRLASYPNQDIKIEVTKIYPLLLKIIKSSCPNKETVGEYLKKYISLVISFISNEQDTKIVRCWLDTITESIDDNTNVLLKDDLNTLFGSLFAIFDLIETSRLAIVNQKSETENKLANEYNDKLHHKEEENLDEYDIEEDDDDDDEEGDNDLENLDNLEEVMNDLQEVLISFTEVIGKLFKTHKMLSLELAMKLLESVLPKYLDKGASIFEIKMGLYILDDLVEHFGQELLGYAWSDIGKILLSYAVSSDDEIRQAASFGLGEFIKHTTSNFFQYSNDILTAIQIGLKMNQGTHLETEFLQAQDNIATALGKIIKYQSSHYQLNQIIPLWVNHLPIVNDPSESAGMHDLLCEIIATQPLLILGNNYENSSQIIRILCKIINSKKYSTDEIDAKIKAILKEFSTNQAIKPAFALAQQGCPKKLLVKIKKYTPK